MAATTGPRFFCVEKKQYFHAKKQPIKTLPTYYFLGGDQKHTYYFLGLTRCKQT